MEKYAKLMKGLEMCAGPSCCKDGCPYYGITTGALTCRARLLLDANIAIVNEQARAAEADEHIVSLNKDIDDLEAANNTYRAERDKLAADNMELRKECDMVVTRCQVLQNEIHALVLKLGKQDGETDRPPVCKELPEKIAHLIGRAKYQEGRADALAAIVERCSFGGGGRHE